MSAAGEARGRGFTLIEMLVVLAILGLIGGIVYPGLERGIRAQEFRAAAGGAATALREGRARALAGGARVVVSAQGGGTFLAVGRMAADALPRSVRVATAPAAGIAFYGDGSSSGGMLSIAGERRVVRFAVAPATGLVQGVAG